MKKTTKLLCGLLGVGLLLTGCATVGNIKNKESELIYNGNSAVMINDSYLYYGNSFAVSEDFKDDKDYKNSAKLSYLARLNVGAELSAKSADYSPKKVENVAKEVAVHEKSFMFALGNYIYYLTPNRKKFENEEGKLVQQYGYSTLYRSKLNGDKKKALYTTSAEVSRVEVLKYGKKYYLVMLAGTNLIRFELGSKAKRTTLAKDVTSVALPKTYEKNKDGSTLAWNGNIYYTKSLDIEDNEGIVSGNKIMKISIAGGEEVEVGSGKDGKSVSLVGREGDIVFYTYDGDTFVHDTNEKSANGSDIRFSISKTAYAVGEISDVYTLYANDVLGYVYTADGSLICRPDGEKEITVTLNYEDKSVDDYNVLFVTGRTMYLATTSAIYAADFSQVLNGSTTIDCTALVKMADGSIYDGDRYAFDGEYVYYYAKLQEIESEDDSDEDKTVSDTTYYLYRTKVGTNADTIVEGSSTKPYELLSLTKSSDRHS